LGIVQSQLRNIEQIAEDTGADYLQMQHFITKSNWDARAVINHVAADINTFLPERKLTYLIIYESGWAKNGNKSLCVGWQSCGNLGKVSNS
jgi:SRSO17 transposase